MTTRQQEAEQCAPAIQTQDAVGVLTWMAELKRLNMLWDMDRPANEAFRDRTPELRAEMTRQHHAAWEICRYARVDIHLLAATAEQGARDLGLSQERRLLEAAAACRTSVERLRSLLD